MLRATNRPPTATHQMPKQVWDNMVATVNRLDGRMATIERRQKRHQQILAASIALIPALTAAIVSIIEALK